MSRWSLVLLVVAAAVALLAASSSAPVGVVARWVAPGLVLAALVVETVVEHRRKAFERRLHLWSAPQQYRP